MTDPTAADPTPAPAASGTPGAPPLRQPRPPPATARIDHLDTAGVAAAGGTPDRHHDPGVLAAIGGVFGLFGGFGSSSSAGPSSSGAVVVLGLCALAYAASHRVRGAPRERDEQPRVGQGAETEDDDRAARDDAAREGTPNPPNRPTRPDPGQDRQDRDAGRANRSCRGRRRRCPGGRSRWGRGRWVAVGGAGAGRCRVGAGAVFGSAGVGSVI